LRRRRLEIRSRSRLRQALRLPARRPSAPTGGRDARGRFAPGNRFAKGNPQAARVGRLRSELIESVKIKDMAEIVASLVERAKAGDTAAAKLLLDRVLGPALAIDVLERIEIIEAAIEAAGPKGGSSWT
jgi:hypothetical protein